MIIPPCSVNSHQSPWRHTPGKCSKYAARYLTSPGSFQNPVGREGNEPVQTSSPLPRCRDLPTSSNTSTRMPSAMHWISPRHTGRMGLPLTKQPAMSVPPDIEDRQTSFFTERYT